MNRTVQPTQVQNFEQAMLQTTDSMQLAFIEIESAHRKQQVAAAKADPKKNRATLVFDPGVEASYRYFAVKAKGKPEVRFCWTVNRNAAGRFLIFKETVTRKYRKRTNIEPILDKRCAIGACRLYRNELIAKREKEKK